MLCFCSVAPFKVRCKSIRVALIKPTHTRTLALEIAQLVHSKSLQFSFPLSSYLFWSLIPPPNHSTWLSGFARRRRHSDKSPQKLTHLQYIYKSWPFSVYNLIFCIVLLCHGKHRMSHTDKDCLLYIYMSIPLFGTVAPASRNSAASTRHHKQKLLLHWVLSQRKRPYQECLLAQCCQQRYCWLLSKHDCDYSLQGLRDQIQQQCQRGTSGRHL